METRKHGQRLNHVDLILRPPPQLGLLGFELASVIHGFVEQVHGVIKHVNT